MVSGILKLLDIVDHNPMFLEKFQWLVDSGHLFEKRKNKNDSIEIHGSGNGQMRSKRIARSN